MVVTLCGILQVESMVLKQFVTTTILIKLQEENFPISNSAYEEGKCAVYRANNTLKKAKTLKKYMFLLSRKLVSSQKNSDAIYAIAEGFNGNTVKGGTGWAVQMAIDSDKDVFVFDQSRSRWFTYDIELSGWKTQ